MLTGGLTGKLTDAKLREGHRRRKEVQGRSGRREHEEDKKMVDVELGGIRWYHRTGGGKKEEETKDKEVGHKQVNSNNAKGSGGNPLGSKGAHLG